MSHDPEFTEAYLIDKLWRTANQAVGGYNRGKSHWNKLTPWPTAYSSQQTQWSESRQCLEDILDCLDVMCGYKDQYNPEGWLAWAYYMDDYWPDKLKVDELSWETIVTAWADASKIGRLYTVLTIDEMRKTVWNEEFVSFHLKAAGEQ